MNIAIIFAGGVGCRMHTNDKPKQFLEMNGKPIIKHTLEHFDEHPEIDGIIVVCVEAWIPFLRGKLEKFNIKKVLDIIPGGSSSQESTRKGLYAVRDYVDARLEDVIVLIHDGVRPLIDAKLISDNINSVKKYGNAITVVPATETIIETNKDGDIEKVADRGRCRLARAPQSFYLSDIISAHERALTDGEAEMIDSAMLMQHYGVTLHTVTGPMENIKITNPMDYHIFRAIIMARENEQIGGLGID